jgi:uncharacterized membrane protein
MWSFVDYERDESPEPAKRSGSSRRFLRIYNNNIKIIVIVIIIIVIIIIIIIIILVIIMIIIIIIIIIIYACICFTSNFAGVRIFPRMVLIYSSWRSYLRVRLHNLQVSSIHLS